MINNITSGKKLSERLHHLDSLRGIACLSVALCHSILIYKRYETFDFFFGRLPVIFFFLLSGFVLSRSLTKTGSLSRKNIFSYYIRRIFRLVPAVMAAVVLTAIFARFLYAHPSPISYQYDWLNSYLKYAGSEHTIAGIFNVLIFHFMRIDPPLWTIRVELFCSFLLPLILAFITKSPLLRSLIVILLFSISLKFLTPDQSIGYPGIFAFFLPFFLGYLVSENSKYIKDITKPQTILAIILLIILLLSILASTDSLGASIILSVLLLVLVPCKWPVLKSFLESPALKFLGKISYSFYLLHLPILFVSWSLLAKCSPRLIEHHCWFSIIFLFFASVSITIPIASIMERFIEEPFNNLGHRLSKKFSST